MKKITKKTITKDKYPMVSGIDTKVFINNVQIGCIQGIGFSEEYEEQGYGFISNIIFSPKDYDILKVGETYDLVTHQVLK